MQKQDSMYCDVPPTSSCLSLFFFGRFSTAVYHFTDLPSFVSGEHLVMFDPHTKYVPGATHVQPGIKVRPVPTAAKFVRTPDVVCLFFPLGGILGRLVVVVLGWNLGQTVEALVLFWVNTWSLLVRLRVLARLRIRFKTGLVQQ